VVSERTSRAVAAAVAVASDLGLRGLKPVVLRDAWHVLVHLRPHRVIARVSVDVVSADLNPDQLGYELAVASHAVAGGAPVAPPADRLDPGPHHRDGHVLTFWRYVDSSGVLDARAAGRGLRQIHEALAGYSGPLPSTGHPDDTARMLAALSPSPDADLLQRAHASCPPVDGQALHGDAHLDNCLPTPAGPLWHDFETACRGPREYDLAALVFRDRVGGGHPAARAALAAYGEHDPELVDAWLPVYTAWVLASMLTALPRRPELEGVVRERLAWLRLRYAREM
jgi:hypothetical protein